MYKSTYCPSAVFTLTAIYQILDVVVITKSAHVKDKEAGYLWVSKREVQLHKTGNRLNLSSLYQLGHNQRQTDGDKDRSRTWGGGETRTRRRWPFDQCHWSPILLRLKAEKLYYLYKSLTFICDSFPFIFIWFHLSRYFASHLRKTSWFKSDTLYYVLYFMTLHKHHDQSSPLCYKTFKL